MIASLPMYERAETRSAHDRFWSLIRDAYRPEEGCPPEHLTRDGDPWDHWLSPELFLSQTCGLPYRARLHGQVTLLGTPDYGIDGAPPGHCYSVIVTRKGDARSALSEFAGAVWAVNDGLSQSGWSAPSEHLAAAGLPEIARLHLTGSHLASARAIATGAADIAALDAVSWRLIKRHEPMSAVLAVLDMTASTPGLPLVTACHHKSREISAAIADAIDRLPARDRVALGGIRGFVAFDPDAYLSLPPAPALPGSAAIST